MGHAPHTLAPRARADLLRYAEHAAWVAFVALLGWGALRALLSTPAPIAPSAAHTSADASPAASQVDAAPQGKPPCTEVRAREGERALFRLGPPELMLELAHFSVATKGAVERADVSLFRSTSNGDTVPLEVRGTELAARIVVTAVGFALDAATPADDGTYLVVGALADGNVARACFRLAVAPAAPLPAMDVLLTVNGSDCVALVSCSIRGSDAVLSLAGDARAVRFATRSSVDGVARVEGALVAQRGASAPRITCVAATEHDAVETSAFLLRANCTYRVFRRGFTLATRVPAFCTRGRPVAVSRKCLDVRVTTRAFAPDHLAVTASLVVPPLLSVAAVVVAAILGLALMVMTGAVAVVCCCYVSARQTCPSY